MKILLIEDDKVAADGLCRLLHQRMDFVECRKVGTFTEGRREAIAFQADITILDVKLPDATTEEVLEGINELPPPVIVVSALIDDDPDLSALCWAYGAKGVLSKRGLLDKIDSIQGVIQKARFIDAVTGSHLRATAPAQLKELKNGHAAPA